MLPILLYRDQIVAALDRHRSVIVTAPPGTGKSTQIPRFFIERATPQKRIIVLEPRRIAARTLAYRVSQEIGCRIGEKVGYQVRFEREASDATRILFCTYGTFLQMLLSDPEAGFTSIIVFDEFHERSLETDAALGWVRLLGNTSRRDLKILVLSATLETGPLQEYLGGCGMIEVREKSFTVALQYQPPKPREPVWQQVERAFGALAASVNGSVLVFLPGAYEIERTADALAVPCKKRGYRVLTLHGRMPVQEQQEALKAPEQGHCVVLSTNVAETSLTIPGVIAVIDSGMARAAGYDPQRDRNTLYLSRISMQNAAQRAGRAGRLGPGVCVRLWSRDDERAMPAAIVPEALRLDLSRSVLTLGAYATMLEKKHGPGMDAFGWLSEPPEDRLKKALDDLVRCEAVERGAGRNVRALPRLTAAGIALSRLPVDPWIGTLLLKSLGAALDINIAMAAIWENAEMKSGESRDVLRCARDFLSDTHGREWGREVRETFGQLKALVKKSAPSYPGSSGNEDDASICRLWMRVFSHRIAGRAGDGAVYGLSDGRSARLIAKKGSGGGEEPPPLILALSIHEQAGGAQNKKVTVPLYLPLKTEWVAQEFPDEVRTVVECRWDEGKKRVIVEEFVRFRNVNCDKKEIADRSLYNDEAATVLAARCLAGDWNWRASEPKAEQFLHRMRLAASAYPDMKIPLMKDDDWELLFHDISLGKRTLQEVKSSSLLHALESYTGPRLVGFIERKAPDSIVLPSGRKGRITYFENAPPELSARLGDLIGYPYRFTVADGRIPGVFDILAPNYRTVQKTADLGSFWKTAYPRIKAELRRRYPKHPWP